jgi:hypothetical protein
MKENIGLESESHRCKAAIRVTLLENNQFQGTQIASHLANGRKYFDGLSPRVSIYAIPSVNFIFMDISNALFLASKIQRMTQSSMPIRHSILSHAKGFSSASSARPVTRSYHSAIRS